MSKRGNVRVRKNSGAIVGSRRLLNFIEDNMSITIADDPTGDEIDITLDLPYDLLEGETAFVGPDPNKDAFTNYWYADGVADNVEAQLAVDYVQAAGGGSVMLEAMRHNWATTVDLPGSLRLMGQISGYGTHTGTMVYLADGANCVMIDTKGEEGGVSLYVTLENIWFYGNKVNQVGAWDLIDFTNARNSYVERCRVHNGSNDGFVGRAVIHKNEFTSNARYGVYALTDCIVDFNHFSGNVADIANDAGSEAQLRSASGANKFINNHIHSSPYGSGIGSGGVDDIIIGNTVMLNQWYGIYMTGNECLVANNLVSNNSQRAVGSVHNIVLSGTDMNTITGNRCWDDQATETTDTGIEVLGSDDNIFTDNYCWGHTDYGISIDGTSNRNVVKHNRLLGNAVACINDGGVDTILEVLWDGVVDPSVTLGRHRVLELPNDADTHAFGELYVPLEFQQLVTAQVVVIPAAGGDMVWTLNTDFGKMCATEDYNAHSDTDSGTDTIVINDLNCIDIAPGLTAVAGGDIVGLDFMRDGDAGGDTINDMVYYKGVRMRYV